MSSRSIDRQCDGRRRVEQLGRRQLKAAAPWRRRSRLGFAAHSTSRCGLVSTMRGSGPASRLGLGRRFRLALEPFGADVASAATPRTARRLRVGAGVASSSWHRRSRTLARARYPRAAASSAGSASSGSSARIADRVSQRCERASGGAPVRSIGTQSVVVVVEVREDRCVRIDGSRSRQAAAPLGFALLAAQRAGLAPGARAERLRRARAASRRTSAELDASVGRRSMNENELRPIRISPTTVEPDQERAGGREQPAHQLAEHQARRFRPRAPAEHAGARERPPRTSDDEHDGDDQVAATRRPRSLGPGPGRGAARPGRARAARARRRAPKPWTRKPPRPQPRPGPPSRSPTRPGSYGVRPVTRERESARNRATANRAEARPPRARGADRPVRPRPESAGRPAASSPAPVPCGA